MGTALTVDAGVGQSETFHRLTPQDVRVDDLGQVVRRDEAVPDLLGIDDDDRAVLALIEASTLVRPDSPLEPVPGQKGLQRGSNRVSTARPAAAARMILRATIAANE